jgi:hypothetical protein
MKNYQYAGCSYVKNPSCYMCMQEFVYICFTHSIYCFKVASDETFLLFVT